MLQQKAQETKNKALRLLILLLIPVGRRRIETDESARLAMSAFGPKRTSLVALHMSAFGGLANGWAPRHRTYTYAAVTSRKFPAAVWPEKSLRG